MPPAQRRADRPRVAVVSRIFTPEAAAATFRLKALVRALVADDVAVEVVTAAPPRGVAPADAEHVPGATVNRWPVLRDEAGYVRGYLQYLSFDLPLAVRLLGMRRPDVVVVEPPPTTGAVVRVCLAVRGLRGGATPYVYYAADIWSDATASMEVPAPVVTVMRAVERFALSGAREVIAVSDGVAERARALGARRVTVVPNGIDTETFTPQGALPAGAPDAPFLLYAGTASEWQGAEIFAEAMGRVVREVPGARLVFLGQGSSWPRLQQLAAGLPPGTIELRPLVPPQEAAAWHRAAAAALVSVRPGIGYDFAYPTKVLAALACGTRVVFAGPGPAAADLADHALGEAVAYDVDAVAAAMIAALRSHHDDGGDDAAARETRDRGHRAEWVRQHRSMISAGAAGAALVLAAATRRRLEDR